MSISHTVRPLKVPDTDATLSIRRPSYSAGYGSSASNVEWTNQSGRLFLDNTGAVVSGVIPSDMGWRIQVWSKHCCSQIPEEAFEIHGILTYRLELDLPLPTGQEAGIQKRSTQKDPGRHGIYPVGDHDHLTRL